MPSKLVAGIVYLVRATGLAAVILVTVITGVSAILGGKGVALAILGSAWMLASAVLSWPRVPDAWRRDPPTERQLAYAASLGIVIPPNATKGQVSDLIEQAKASRF